MTADARPLQSGDYAGARRYFRLALERADSVKASDSDLALVLADARDFVGFRCAKSSQKKKPK
jgi:hypothetical protein